MPLVTTIPTGPGTLTDLAAAGELARRRSFGTDHENLNIDCHSCALVRTSFASLERA